MEAALANGSLRRPSAAAPSFVDLVCAVHRGAGVAEPPSPFCEAISSHLFERRHLALVLVDGMGMTALADPEVADLRARVRLELDSVFPATTACAMTTVATGRWPAQHGVPGWWAYLAEHDLSATVLPFLERHSERRLRRYGVQAAEVWPLPSRFAEITGNMQVHVPLVYLLSTFNRYLSGRCATRGYRSLRQAQRRIMRRLRSVSRRGAAPTITYWYIPDYDSACHTYGVASTQARGTLQHIQALLLELAAMAPDDTLVAVTADHGLIDLDRPGPRAAVPRETRCSTACAAHRPARAAHPTSTSAPERKRNWSSASPTWPATGWPCSVRARPRSCACSARSRSALSPAAASATTSESRSLPFTLAYYESADATSLRHVGVHGGMCPAEVRIPLAIL